MLLSAPDLTTATLFLLAYIKFDSPPSSLLSMLPTDLFPAFINSLTFPPSLLINYIGFRSQLVSCAKFLFWFLNPNWVLLQDILWIIFTPLYLQLFRSSVWQVSFVLQIRTTMAQTKAFASRARPSLWNALPSSCLLMRFLPLFS